MAYNTYQETRATLKADGPAVTGTTDASLLNADARGILYPDELFVIGRQIKQIAVGRISTTTGSNTLAISTRFGSVLVANPALTAITLVASQTNVTVWIETLMTLRAVGSGTAANLMWQQNWASVAIGGTSPIASGALIPASAPAVGNGYDQTAAQVVDLYAKWSAASNTITLHQYRLEILN